MGTIAITGATSGIGEEASVALARLGHRILVIGRNKARGAAVLERVAAANRRAQHRLLIADLSLVGEARRLAGELAYSEPRLDVLANNAGAIFAGREETAEGVERTFATDHLGPWVLTNELMPLLRSSGARVIQTSSIAHRGARLDPADWELRRGWSSWRAYCNAKLMNLLMTRELRRREGRLTAVAFHPGFIASRFGTTGEGMAGLGGLAQRLVAKTPEAGARTLVHLAHADLGRDPAPYWADAKPKRPSRQAEDDGLAGRLWAESARLADHVGAVPA